MSIAGENVEPEQIEVVQKIDEYPVFGELVALSSIDIHDTHFSLSS